MATQEISDFTGLNGENVGTFVDVLRSGSALAQVVPAAGGQVHSATAFAGCRRHEVAGARPAALAEIQAGAVKADPAQLVALAALRLVLGVDGACTVPAAGTEKGLVFLDLDHMGLDELGPA